MIPSRFALVLLGVFGLLFVFALIDVRFAWAGLAADVGLLALVVVDGWRARSTRLRAERSVSRPLHQGEAARVAWRLENAEARGVQLKLRDALAPELVAEPHDADLELAAGTSLEHGVTIHPRVRGDATLDRLALRVLGPLGLAWADRELLERETVRVLPRAHLEGDAGLLVEQALRRQLGAHPIARRGISTELYGVREYLPGDEYRSIHWKASARLHRPVTRETTWERHQHLVVMVDCGRPMASRAGAYSKLDHTLTAVLALLRVAVAQRDSALLVLFSQEVRKVIAVDQRTRSFAPIFEAVFDEQPDLAEPDYAAIAAWCARRVPRRSLALVCTSVLDLLAADVLGTALKGLAARHRPLLVNLQDPVLVDTARSVPETVPESYAKAAAMGMMAANAELETRLRASGIDTISQPASQLAVGVIRAYLDAKARRRF